MITEAITAVLLVGGMGTRLRSVVPSTPKPLAAVGNRSFLELLIRQLRYQGIRHLVMCTGYLADQIESELGDGHKLDVEIEYSREPHPLGTGGAVKLARRYLHDAPDFVVMNGDSFIEIDFGRLIAFHREHSAVLSMAVRSVENASRYGTVQVDAEQRVTSFAEKTRRDVPGLVNAGVYVVSSTLFENIPDGPASLERDVFPGLLGRAVYALEQQGMFIDIGTPEEYARAQEICGRLFAAALNK
jgi:NDP-sugar pyrophosphorylase family protein